MLYFGNLCLSENKHFMSFLKKILGKSLQGEKHNEEKVLAFEKQKSKIYPWVKAFVDNTDNPKALLQIDLPDENFPIWRTWLGDLAIFYVADMGDRFEIILKNHLPKNISVEQLHQLAIENLSRDIEYKLNETNFGAYGLIADGNHETSSICLPEIWDWIAGILNDNLIVAIPTKSLIMMAPETNIDKVSNLKIVVHKIFKEGEHLLTRNIFKFERDSKKWIIIDTVN